MVVVESSSSTLDVAALKVAELKEELSKRSLPTNGLKKDLAERLREAIEADAGVEEVASEEKVDGEAVDIVEEPSKDDVNGQADAASVQPNEVETSDAKDGVEAVDIPIEQVQAAPLEAKDAVEVEVASAHKEDTMPSDEHKDAVIATDEQAPAAIEVVSKVTDTEPIESESLADRMGERVAKADIEEVDLGVDQDADIETNVDELDAAAIDASAETETADVVMKDEEKRLTSHHPNGLSPHSDPPLMLSPNEASTAKAIIELDEEARKLSKPSRTVYVGGLVRPLTLPSFKSKMEEYGLLEKGDSVWLDGVKTHAYVTYAEIESATKAIEDMSGSVYPPDTGKEVRLEYIPHEIVNRCIAIEELAWQEDRGKMELRARRADQGDALIYSLHRLEATSVVQRVEPRAPLAQTFNHRGPSQSNRIPPAGPAKLEWGAGSSSSSHDRFRREPIQDYTRRDYRSGGTRGDYHTSRDGRGPYGNADRRDPNRGSSRADDRVREVEARILAERERGERPLYRSNYRNGYGDATRSPQYSNGRSYGGASNEKDRWSRDRDVPRKEENYSRSSYSDRRREYSPPPPRRDYAETDRDEFGRDRHRRD